MKIFKQLFCRHQWVGRRITEFEFEIGTGLNNPTKSIAEVTICKKCLKRQLHWIKKPQEAAK